MLIYFFQNKCADEEAQVLLSVSALIVTGRGSLLLLNYRHPPLFVTSLYTALLL